MSKQKTIALVAHDNRKKDLAEWVAFNYRILSRHKLICTGTTGKMVEEVLQEKLDRHEVDGVMPSIVRLKSGPLGGDQQLGALISEDKIEVLIFFWDPMQPQPHDVDVKALLRIAVLYNIPVATNLASADFMITSPLFEGEYRRKLKDYGSYLNRPIKT